VVIEEWVSILVEERPAAISIHGRTLAQMYRGQADWEAIARAAKLVRQTDTLVLGNGDVDSMEELVRRVQDTHVHGVLIGRGALGNPWFFRAKDWAKAQASNRGQSGDGTVPVPLEERFRVALEHARYFEALGGTSRFAAMRKHLGWYCTGFFKAAEVRAQMFRAGSSQDVERILAGIVLDVPESVGGCRS
jgi:tRNA-dihydrouridine synthase